MLVQCSSLTQDKTLIEISTTHSLSAACAPPYIGIVRGLWEGDCLTEHRCPLARPLGMPSGHVAHASLRGDAQIH